MKANLDPLNVVERINLNQFRYVRAWADGQITLYDSSNKSAISFNIIELKELTELVLDWIKARDESITGTQP